jgi:hypothetical protein
MANKWLAHMKKTMRMMKKKKTYKKGMGLKQVIEQAKLTYKKGGADDEKVMPEPAVPDAPAAEVEKVAGRRKTRRGGKSKKTRRASRK